jgi:hypothetical protein
MKRNWMIVVTFSGVLLASSNVMADKDLTEQQVPPAVLKTFKSVYPKATDVEYEGKSDHGQKLYKIEFKDNDGLEHTIVYSADGQVLKAELGD